MDEKMTPSAYNPAMNNVHPYPRRFTVMVTHAVAQDAEDATMWVAECDALHLATEAPTYDALIERVWAVVPDAIEANEMGIDVRAVRLRFEFEDSAEDCRFAL